MLKWGEMVAIGQLPVHLPHWMQGKRGSRRIWANRSAVSDIGLPFRIPLNLNNGECAARAPFHTGRIGRFTAQVAFQGDLGTRFEKDFPFRTGSTAEDTFTVLLSADHHGIAGGALCIGVWSRQNRYVVIIFHIQIYSYPGKAGINVILKVLE